jgi:hypothetical protein
MSLVYEREMTITHKEFLRLLPKALRDRAYSQKGNEITVRIENNSVLINLSEQSIRKIASLELPVTTIRIELIGFEKNESINFMSRFDLAFQKGGG